MKNIFKKRISSYLLIICLAFVSLTVADKNLKKDFYQIKVYYLKDNAQILAVDQYLKDAYLPALHRAGINKVGVFKPIANDTAQVKKICVFIPFTSLKEWQNLQGELDKDISYQSASKDYTDAPADKKPFERIESINFRRNTGRSQQRIF